MKAEEQQVHSIAIESKTELDLEPTSFGLRREIIRTALATGFPDIWMEVFSTDVDMLCRIAHAFSLLEN